MTAAVLRALPSASPGTGGAAAARVERSPARAGFTLIELMCVMALLGLLLLLLPPRLDGLGDRSKLESTASTLVSVLTAAREMAVIDGHETRVQFDLPATAKDRRKTGRFRYLVTSRKREQSQALLDPDDPASKNRPESTHVVDEWVETEWRSLPVGVVITGFSVQAGQWIRSNPRGDPVEVAFEADGTVITPCAIELQNVDLAENAARTMTVIVNALTSLAEVVDGKAELEKSRDPSDFR